MAEEKSCLEQLLEILIGGALLIALVVVLL